MMLFGINLAASKNLLFLIAIVIASGFLLVKWYLWKRYALSILSHKKYIMNLIQNFSFARNNIKMLLLFLGLIFLSISLLRPQWGSKDEIIHQEGRDLLIAIDISRSMLCEDVKPNRLEFAKEKIKKLVKELKSERVGLIIFSGEAFLQCPLTSDIDSFFSFVEALDVETISSGSTSLDSAIRKSFEIFQSMPSKKNKLLIIYTDGEDFSQNLEGLKEEAQKLNLKIFTVGIGTLEGAPIPILDKNLKTQGYQKDEEGNIVISRLNESLLENLSLATQAFYVHSDQYDKDINIIASKVQQFEKEVFDDTENSTLEEKYFYFAVLGLICFIINWLL